MMEVGTVVLIHNVVVVRFKDMGEVFAKQKHYFLTVYIICHSYVFLRVPREASLFWRSGGEGGKQDC